MILSKIVRKIKIFSRRMYYRFFCPNICVGRNLTFRRNFLINVSPKGKVLIGNDVFFNNYVTINSHEMISIGDQCIFGENVKIYDHNHKFTAGDVSISEQGYTCRHVHIGNNCWIGSGVIILAGATIGDHVVIGAGCVISENVESGTIVRLKQEKIYERIRISKGK